MVAVAVAFPFPEPIEYPESDGEPMAETDLHRDEMADTIDTLKDRYARARDVYVAGNNFIYYEEGNPAARFSPDVYVVRGVPKGRRRIYKLWEEKRAPAFVLEVSSRGTRREDKISKKALCAKLQVEEYFLFDPENDYLKPPLQGYRLVRGRYEPIPASADGSVPSAVLGLILTRDEGGRLRLIDAATGVPLLRPEESRGATRDATALAEREAKRAEREAKRAEREAKRAAQAEARATAAEAEIERLRALLKRRG